MTDLKPLYIGGSLKELNQKSQYSDGGRSIRTHISFADKAFSAAEDALKGKDEERAYVLFMKYLDIVKMVRKSSAYRKDPKHFDTLIGTKKLVKGLDEAERLAKSLEKRYEKVASEKTISPKTSKEKETKIISNGVIEDDFIFPKEQLDSQELYTILYKKAKNVLVIDIRSATDFKASHIRHEYCINVPNDVIKPGCVPAKVEKGIESEHKAVWNSRDSVDLIVLVDWMSSLSRVENLSDPLRSLKDCIFKWDHEKTLKRSPVVLEGGYTDFLGAFPQYLTNPQVKVPNSKPEVKTVNSLLDFDYSDLRPSMKPSQEKTEEISPPVSPISSKSPVSSAVNNNSISNGSYTPAADTSPKHSPVKKLNGAAISNGLYPSLSNIPTNGSLKNIPEKSSQQQTTVIKPMPKFDRSTKPSTKQHVQPDIKPVIEPQKKPPPELPEVRKPEVKRQPVVIDHSDEISERERRIAEMEELKNKKEFDLKQIEQQKKLAELKAREEAMKKSHDDLDSMTKKAEKDLAATMRGLAKPNAEKPETKAPDNNVPSKIANEPKRSNEIADSQMDDPVAKKPVIELDVEKPKTSINKPTQAKMEDKPVTNPVEKQTKSTTNFKSTTDTHIFPTLPPVQKVTKPTAVVPSITVAQKPNIVDPPKISQPPKPKPVQDQPVNLVPPVVKPVDRSVKPHIQAPASKPVQSSVSESKVNTSKSVQRTVSQKPKPQLTRSNSSSGGGFGLKRSSSSPNIAKMVQDEAQTPLNKTPIVPNRVSKPKILSPEASNFEAMLDRSLQGVYGGNDSKALCGLRNLGNSCYMNSTLQCLFSTTQLAQYVLQFEYRKDINRNSRMGSGGKVAEAFTVLLRAAWNGQFRYIVPRDFKNTIGSKKPMFLKTTQEDAQEFLMCLLDELHEDLNRMGVSKYVEEPDNDNLSDTAAAEQAWKCHKSRNESIVVELFSGQFKATLQCLQCGKVSRKFDTFMYLSLPLPQHQAKIIEVISSFTKSETLRGSDKWYCPTCKTHREARRTIEIWKLPPVLIIHFKRFVSSGPWLDKIHTNISYPITGLDLGRFIQGPKKRKPYDLYAVSHHQGPGLDSGHYTASCKNAVNQSWYKFDDTEVYQTAAPSGSTSFILFYSCYSRVAPVYNS
uniref:ubiquitinyl hydrolase 1 n=1 Tax=Phallusia mammillata TaxID=59560 RepID=A0A6F9DWM4_9ASCI|nr:ubiquitin carboxyl-terminal hydrolase 8-like [Phallusia mammillata]